MLDKKNYFFILILLGLLLTAPGTKNLQAGEKKDNSLLNLKRIYTEKEFKSKSFGPARWLKKKKGYTTLEDSPGEKEGKDIVFYHPASTKKKILVPAQRLIPTGADEPLEIDDYQWSKNGKLLLVFTDTKKVWRRNTRGDYWVLNLQNWKLQKLGGNAEPSTLMFAKFSPQSDRVGYVCKNNIFVQDLEDMSIIQLTADGSKTLINGTFDWVYEEEFSLRDGFRWSPDGKFIAYWQLDSSGVKNFHMINNTGPLPKKKDKKTLPKFETPQEKTKAAPDSSANLYPELITFPYPKPGETNSACRVGVIASRGGKTRWFETPGDPRNHYIARMEWAESSEEIVLQHLNRLQNTNRVTLGNIHTGKVRTVFTDSDDTWVEVCDDLEWLDKGKSFTFVSEKDGWKHVYRVSRNGEKVKAITPGDFDVISIEGIEKKGGWLYYIASPQNAAQRYLYRSRLDGTGKAERITPANQPGTHGYQISPGAKWAFHTYSAFGQPTVTDLVRLPSHRKVRTLEANTQLKKKVETLKKGAAGFFRIDIGGGVLLDCWCMKPANFDPGEKYPVLLYVYGEPWGQTVLDRWGGNNYLWHLLLTQQGYIVMSIDNRGTSAPRGRQWRKCIYRQIGILASADQAAALKAITAKFPYVDAARIGIWGWSGGGSMSLNAIFRYPELYRTAMCIAAVPNQRFYDTIYQERYMGLPADNATGYKEGSPITHAHRLKGSLLIVHGTGDDNCHYQGFEALVNELIAYNKHFTMMSYPNRSHSIREGENTSRHLFELLTRYLKENLPPGENEKKRVRPKRHQNSAGNQAPRQDQYGYHFFHMKPPFF
ncbi:MAG: S9 family peptidase [Candidatus Aminicenantes bacterium]|nr:S9 family peptidase [Candidatus Aminicenantes bacterium]